MSAREITAGPTYITPVRLKKHGRIIKLSKNLKPFVSRVSRYGATQIAFAELIGEPVGQCVKAKLKDRPGFSGLQVKWAVAGCAKQVEGRSIRDRIEEIKRERREGRYRRGL